MKIADIKGNDVVDCDKGICVSLWAQGCHHHCFNCHNPNTWDFNGGREFDVNIIADKICKLISQNGIKRDFSILGGEPLCKENRKDVLTIIWEVRKAYPNIKIYLWTGYTYEKLLAEQDPILENIFANIDILIDGPYIDSQRDITLKLRGSSNQRIIELN